MKNLFTLYQVNTRVKQLTEDCYFAAAPRSAVYIFVSLTSNSWLGEAGLSMSAGGDLCDEV